MRRFLLIPLMIPVAAYAASFTLDETFARALEIDEDYSAARLGFATAFYNYNVALLELERAAGTLDGKY